MKHKFNNFNKIAVSLYKCQSLNDELYTSLLKISLYSGSNIEKQANLVFILLNMN